MNGKQLYKELNSIGDDIIEEALNSTTIKGELRTLSLIKKRWILITACLCLLFCCLILNPLLQDRRSDKMSDSIQIMASDLISQAKGLVFGDASTKAYFTMESDSLSKLMRSPVKNNTVLPALTVYKTVLSDPHPYFIDKVQNITQKLKSNFDISLSDENYTSYEDYNHYYVDLISDNFSIQMDTSDSRGTIETNYRIWDNDRPIQYLELFGEKIIITADESDESILDKLSGALAFVNKLFGTNCKFQYISRSLESIDEGYVSLSVEAYEDSDDMNQAMYNQYLDSIDFLFMGENQDELPLVGIYYTEYELEKAFPSDVTLISVQDAERNLKKGYIFAGHVCPACMSANKEVDFENYDGVEIVYRRDTFGKYVIPFYAFYKDTGDKTYAVAYVPAVEVSGMREYFTEQESWHNND
ncbi:MAG: hypothetical protein K0S47_4301 [Herbinix sp.]|jgi:hypothetical protein|nr:hypothetical protein [Herbinix sp.]